jgi:hypothetical protein
VGNDRFFRDIRLRIYDNGRCDEVIAVAADGKGQID